MSWDTRKAEGERKFLAVVPADTPHFSKLKGEHPARNLYCGQYFNTLKAYVQSSGDPWWMEAQHGT